MLEFAKPYIEAFKTGSPTPVIKRDMLVYWHRPTLKNVECDATDSCGAKPAGWEVCYTSSDILEANLSQVRHDEVFVAAFTRTRGKVEVTSGNNAIFSQDVPIGVTMLRVPMASGVQNFHFSNDAGVDVQGRSPLVVETSCIVSLLRRSKRLS
jgi:glucan endo-1,3-alpha-glucosidase